MASADAVNIDSVTLNDGQRMPLLALGSIAFFTDPAGIADQVYEAIKMGYRHFDSAWIYQTEQWIGQGVARAIADGLVQRSDLFLSSKIWITDMRADALAAQARECNRHFGQGYMDLLLLHGPVPYLVTKGKGSFDLEQRDEQLDVMKESWGAMEQLVRDDIVKSIGVANFGIEDLQRLLDSCAVKPAVNQIETHPLFQATKTLSLCQAHGIVMMAHSPLGGYERPKEAAQDGGQSQRQPQERPAYARTRDELWHSDVVKRIADKHSATVPQVILKFQVDRCVAVACRSSKAERMRQNAAIFHAFHLDDQDRSALAGLDQSRSCIPDYFRRLHGMDQATF